MGRHKEYAYGKSVSEICAEAYDYWLQTGCGIAEIEQKFYIGARSFLVYRKKNNLLVHKRKDKRGCCHKSKLLDKHRAIYDEMLKEGGYSLACHRNGVNTSAFLYYCRAHNLPVIGRSRTASKADICKRAYAEYIATSKSIDAICDKYGIHPTTFHNYRRRNGLQFNIKRGKDNESKDNQSA